MKRLGLILLAMVVLIGNIGIEPVVAGATHGADTFYVMGVGSIFASEWKPCDPAHQMTSETDGFWVKTYTNLPIGSYQFQITDGTGKKMWTDPFGKSEGYQFATKASGTLTVTFNQTTNMLDCSFTPNTTQSTPMMTVYVQAPDHWSECYAYWQGSSVAVERPGMPMFQNDEGLWSTVIPMDASELTFVNGPEWSRTTMVPLDDRIQYVVSEDTWVYHNMAYGDLSNVRVVGNAPWMGDWDVSDEAGRMTLISEGVYEARFTNVTPGHYEFRVAQNNTWGHSWGSDSGNYKLDVNETGTVVVTFTLEERYGTIRVAVLPDPALYCVPPEGWETCNVYWWGSTTECIWPGEPMERYTKDVWTKKVPADATNVVFNSHDTSNGGGLQTYNLTIPAGNKKVYHVEANAWTALNSIVGGTYYVMGDSGLCGDFWLSDAPQNQMTGNGRGQWTKIYENIAPGTYELQVCDGTWSNRWSDHKPGTDDDAFVLEVFEKERVVVIFDAIRECVQVGGNPTDEIVYGKSYRVIGNAPWMGNWDPANDKGLMTEVQKGVYEAKFPNVAPGNYELKVTGDKTGLVSWGNANGVCSFRVTRPSNVTVTFTQSDYQIGRINIQIDPVAVPTNTIYCQAPEKWAVCNVFWWGSAEVISWPGVAMTMREDGIWSYDVPSDATNIIFNNGSAQSQDLYYPDASNRMYVYELNQWMPYTGNKVEIGIDGTYYVAGNATLCGSEFNPADPANAMIEGGDGTWIKVYQDVVAGTYYLKVTDGTWDRTWRDDVPGSDPVMDSYVLEISETTDVKIIFDPVNEIVTVETGVFDDAPDPPSGDNAPGGDDAPGGDNNPGDENAATDYYLVGFINGMDYGIGIDSANLGEYKFVDGKITVKFKEDSDIVVKNGANRLFMAQSYCEDTTVILFSGGCGQMKAPAGKELTFTLTQNADGTLTLSYTVNGSGDNSGIGGNTGSGDNGDNKEPPKDDDDAVLTLFAKVPASWTTVYAYTWDTGNAPQSGDWPGSPMTHKDGWYQLPINDKVANVIISNGTEQSCVLEVASGKDIYILAEDPANATVVYADGSDQNGNSGNMGSGEDTDGDVTGGESSYRVVGNADWMGGWNPGSNAGRMVEVSPGVYKKNFENVQPGDYRFRISANGTWDQWWGDKGGDFCFTVSKACTISITFTLKDGIGKIEVAGLGIGDAPPSGEDSGTSLLSNFRVVGNAPWMGDWDPANEAGRMQEVSPGVYKKKFDNVKPGDYELKITQNGTWNKSWGDNGNNFCFTVRETCAILVTFTLNGEIGTIRIIGDGVVSTPTSGGDNETDPPERPNTGPTVDVNPSDPGHSGQNTPGQSGDGSSSLNPNPSNPGSSGDGPHGTTGNPSPPDQTLPDTDPTYPVENPGDASPDSENLPGELNPSDAEQTTQTEVQEELKISPLVNSAIHSFNMVLFGSVAVCIYALFLLLRKKQEAVVQTVDGTQFRAYGPLSVEATEQLVSSQPPAGPSRSLDLRIMESIKKAEADRFRDT